MKVGQKVKCPGCHRLETFDSWASAVMSGWKVQVSRQVFVCPDCKVITTRVCDALLLDLRPEGSLYPDLHAPVGGGIWCYRRRESIEVSEEGKKAEQLRRRRLLNKMAREAQENGEYDE